MATNELVPVPRYTLQELRDVAEVAAKSGLFRMTGPQILVLMLVAESEGLHPIRAMQMYDIVDGRPALKAVTMLARFQEAGGTVEWIETSDQAAEAIFTHQGCPKGVRIRYTIDDAKVAGLANKDNWKKHPSDMLVARVSARGVRRALPGVIMGLYDPDELEAPAPSNGEKQAQTKLVATLQGKRDPEEMHRAAAEAEFKPSHPHPVFAYLQEQARQYNDVLDRLKLESPDDERIRKAKAMSEYQLGGHVLKQAEVDGTIQENDYKTKGKSDPAKGRPCLERLWDSRQDEVESLTQEYLQQQLYAVAPSAVATSAGE